jgi:hypothetical protein
MTSSERQRRFLARIRERAAAVTAASTPTPTPSAVPDDNVPSLSDSLHPERTAARLCEWLIAMGWTIGRLEAFHATFGQTVGRHKSESDY